MEQRTTQTRAPHKGDVIHYRGRRAGVVVSVEGNLCWTLYDGDSAPLPFIWRFRDGFNTLHDWPGKEARS